MTPSVAEAVRGGFRDNWTQVARQGDPIVEARAEIRDITVNIAVFLLADKYCMDELRAEVVERLERARRSKYGKELVDVGKDHLEDMSGMLKE